MRPRRWPWPRPRSPLPREERALQMTSEDVASNESGVISEKQRSELRRHRLLNLAGCAGFFVLLALVAVAVAIKVAYPSFGARGPFWIGSAFAVFWLALLSRTCRRYGRICRDLREGHLDSVTGVVSHQLSSTPGIIRFLRYSVRCGGHRFSVNQDAFFRLQEGDSYRVYYARHSNVFLGAAPCSSVSSTSGSGASGVSGRANDLKPPLPALAQAELEPLLEREREVLELIAAGLSNQEIADRLYLSVPTIKMYASQLYRKLGVRRRTEAVRRARQEGLLPPL